MLLLDSNILIYAAKEEYTFLRDLISAEEIAISLLTKLEVLGFNRLLIEEMRYYQDLFESSVVLPIDEDLIDIAISLRQERKIGLADAIIAATALMYKKTLVTRNTEDFKWIKKLKCINPFEHN